MSLFLQDATLADTFRCDVCGGMFVRAMMHEHHRVKQATGGADTRTNIAFVDSNCHYAIHQIEKALQNPAKRLMVQELLERMYSGNARAQQNCLLLATTAALGHDPNEPTRDPAPDYSVYDTDDWVHLTPPRVTPWVRRLAQQVAKQLRHPQTGKPLGVSSYLRFLLEQDLVRRGFSLAPPPKA